MASSDDFSKSGEAAMISNELNHQTRHSAAVSAVRGEPSDLTTAMGTLVNQEKLCRDIEKLG